MTAPVVGNGMVDLIRNVEGRDLEAVGATILQHVLTVPGVVATKTLAGTKF